MSHCQGQQQQQQQQHQWVHPHCHRSTCCTSSSGDEKTLLQRNMYQYQFGTNDPLLHVERPFVALAQIRTLLRRTGSRNNHDIDNNNNDTNNNDNNDNNNDTTIDDNNNDTTNHSSLLPRRNLFPPDSTLKILSPDEERVAMAYDHPFYFREGQSIGYFGWKRLLNDKSDSPVLVWGDFEGIRILPSLDTIINKEVEDYIQLGKGARVLSVLVSPPRPHDDTVLLFLGFASGRVTIVKATPTPTLLSQFSYRVMDERDSLEPKHEEITCLTLLAGPNDTTQLVCSTLDGCVRTYPDALDPGNPNLKHAYTLVNQDRDVNTKVLCLATTLIGDWVFLCVFCDPGPALIQMRHVNSPMTTWDECQWELPEQVAEAEMGEPRVTTRVVFLPERPQEGVMGTNKGGLHKFRFQLSDDGDGGVDVDDYFPANVPHAHCGAIEWIEIVGNVVFSSGGYDGCVRAWNSKDLSPLGSFQAHTPRLFQPPEPLSPKLLTCAVISILPRQEEDALWCLCRDGTLYGWSWGTTDTALLAGPGTHGQPAGHHVAVMVDPMVHVARQGHKRLSDDVSMSSGHYLVEELSRTLSGKGFPHDLSIPAARHLTDDSSEQTHHHSADESLPEQSTRHSTTEAASSTQTPLPNTAATVVTVDDRAPGPGPSGPAPHPLEEEQPSQVIPELEHVVPPPRLRQSYIEQRGSAPEQPVMDGTAMAVEQSHDEPPKAHISDPAVESLRPSNKESESEARSEPDATAGTDRSSPWPVVRQVAGFSEADSSKQSGPPVANQSLEPKAASDPHKETLPPTKNSHQPCNERGDDSEELAHNDTSLAKSVPENDKGTPPAADPMRELAKTSAKASPKSADLPVTRRSPEPPGDPPGDSSSEGGTSGSDRENSSSDEENEWTDDEQVDTQKDMPRVTDDNATQPKPESLGHGDSHQSPNTVVQTLAKDAAKGSSRQNTRHEADRSSEPPDDPPEESSSEGSASEADDEYKDDPDEDNEQSADEQESNQNALWTVAKVDEFISSVDHETKRRLRMRIMQVALQYQDSPATEAIFNRHANVPPCHHCAHDGVESFECRVLRKHTTDLDIAKGNRQHSHYTFTKLRDNKKLWIKTGDDLWICHSCFVENKGGRCFVCMAWKRGRRIKKRSAAAQDDERAARRAARYPSDGDEASVDAWKCSGCSEMNPSVKSSCRACGQRAGGSKRMRVPQEVLDEQWNSSVVSKSPTSHSSNWECDGCFNENHMAATKCHVCGNRPAKMSRIEQMRAQEEHDEDQPWNCRKCTFQNEASALSCQVCQARRGRPTSSCQVW